MGEAFVKFNKTDPTILHTSPSFHVERVKKGKYAWIGLYPRTGYIVLLLFANQLPKIPQINQTRLKPAQQYVKVKASNTDCLFKCLSGFTPILTNFC
jgi:hypothetical protein